MTWVHRMLSVDPDTMIGECASCGMVRVKRKRNTSSGQVRYACRAAEDRWKGTSRKQPGRLVRYAHLKRAVCERCGFVPVNSCQLDVHHLDGDRDNNELSNLQTLCANCHRLDTMVQLGYISPS